MKSLAKELFNYIKGVPFIDDGFLPEELISIVACKRKIIDDFEEGSLEEYLNPEKARRIYLNKAVCSPPLFEYEELNTKLIAEIDNAKHFIETIIPNWSILFDLEVDYFLINDGRFSSTSALIPQTIFLSNEAFEDEILLMETLVHEHSHLWLSFIIEIVDLQKENFYEEFTLPSGTKGKQLRGVFYAAHFSACAIKFYISLKEKNQTSLNRLKYLNKYLESCLHILESESGISEMGIIVYNSLRTFHKKITNNYEIR